MAENYIGEEFPISPIKRHREGDLSTLLASHPNEGVCMAIRFHYSPFGEMDLTWTESTYSYPTKKEDGAWVSRHPFTRNEFMRFEEGSLAYAAFEMLLEAAEQERVLMN